jgi:hypothetical protein
MSKAVADKVLKDAYNILFIIFLWNMCRCLALILLALGPIVMSLHVRRTTIPGHQSLLRKEWWPY